MVLYDCNTILKLFFAYPSYILHLTLIRTPPVWTNPRLPTKAGRSRNRPAVPSPNWPAVWVGRWEGGIDPGEARGPRHCADSEPVRGIDSGEGATEGVTQQAPGSGRGCSGCSVHQPVGRQFMCGEGGSEKANHSSPRQQGVAGMAKQHLMFGDDFAAQPDVNRDSMTPGTP